MSEAMELYEQAVKSTGIENQEEALNAYIASDFGYSNDDYLEESKIIEKGDTVRLKSGSPLMTITDIDGYILICSWFQNARVQTLKFSEVLMTLVDKSVHGGFMNCLELEIDPLYIYWGYSSIIFWWTNYDNY